MTEFRDFIEKAERDVSKYFRYCPLCFAENSMQFQWGLKEDAMTCSNCGAKWHINHGITGFHWAKLVKVNAEGRGAELLGEKNYPFFWQQMALNGVRLPEGTHKKETEEPKEQLAEEKEVSKEETAEIKEEKPWWRNPLKYFLHGISFSVLLLVLAFAWAFILGILVILGSFIGLIIGFVVLFFLIGGLNTFLTGVIWSITAETRWTSLLGHGFLLFIALLIVSVPSVILNLAVPSLVTTIVTFVAYAFIDGFVAKKTAEYFEEVYEVID